MRRIILTPLSCLLLGMFGISQNTFPVSGYFHLEGTINNSQPATIEMVKINDSIFADFLLEGPGNSLKNGKDDMTGFSPRMFLCGSMEPDGTLSLKDPFSEKGLQFSGKADGDLKIIGNLENNIGQKFTCVFSEKYPVGSVQLNLYNTKDVKKLVKKSPSPEAKINLGVLLPAESANALISDSLGDIIRRRFFGKTVPDSTPEAMLNVIKDVFFENYTSSNETLFEEMPESASFNWEMLKYMHILNNRDYLFTFYIITYGFAGGAHGLETFDYYSVDLKSGKLLELTDIFPADSLTSLANILTNKLRQMSGLKENQKLTDSGYFSDEIKPIENFYLTDSGIGFFYNHYDIAPYSSGSTDIFLTFDELKNLLK